MALNPNVVVVAPGELITAAHLNNIRANLDRLDTTKVGTTGNWTMGGVLTATGGLVTPNNVSAGSTFKASASDSRLFLGKAAPNLDTVGVEGFGVGQINITNSAAGQSNLSVQHQNVASATGERFITFRTQNQGIIGSITQVGTTQVAYNTSSDYRLKTVLGDVDNPLDLIDRLHPVLFTWTDDPDAGTQHGFLAHEVAEVVPYAVQGDKDAVFPDDDPIDAGRIIPQQLDVSRLVPLVVAALQDLAGRVATLEATA